ncbi:hypothetical protein MCHIJ_18470 [Mycolicibacterium chitae]|uniref:Type II secretion system protein F domain-containing protein n=1 Tax=Mycolicibacterium chitae TaxID=1792 RepID=A0A448HXM2_MYCCI|nr:type II secretion system F family protein [Mycolicibacterium chitae]BBZ02410.1 hypothetical protein MCHIJ_18470 [Mycolicibacterium chitae]VEG44941.1 type II secretion system protein F domain-containing protein [Mycolicibacterium chitae]
MTAAALALAAALLVNPAAAAGRWRIGGRSAPAAPEPLDADDPLAVAASLDVLSVCLAAGMSVAAAARATATSAPPELAMPLRRAADLLALGADPATAWAARPDEVTDEHCVALLRLARRSAASGAALASGVAELAEQSRQAAVHRAEATAERAAVVIAGPLGLCFLPAFVCLGVVPVVVGLAGEVLGSGLL